MKRKKKMNNEKNYEALERAARIGEAYRRKLNQNRDVLVIRPDEEPMVTKYNSCEWMMDYMEDFRREVELPEIRGGWMVMDERTIMKVGNNEFLLGPVIFKIEEVPGYLRSIDEETVEQIKAAVLERCCTLCENDREFKAIEL